MVEPPEELGESPDHEMPITYVAPELAQRSDVTGKNALRHIFSDRT